MTRTAALAPSGPLAALAAWTAADNGVLLAVVVAMLVVLGVGLVALARSVTRRRPAIRTLADRLDSIPAPPGLTRYAVQRDGTVLDSATEPTLTGLKPGQAVGRSIWEWATPAARTTDGRSIEAIWKAALAGAACRYRQASRDAAGRERVHETDLLPLSDGTVYGESRDVTDNEAELCDLRTQLQHAEDDLDAIRPAVAEALGLPAPR